MHVLKAEIARLLGLLCYLSNSAHQAQVLNLAATFAEHGGVKRLDSVLDKQLDTVLEELSEAVWA